MTLKDRIAEGRVLLAPGVFDALSALLAERAGAEAAYSGTGLPAQPVIGLPWPNPASRSAAVVLSLGTRAETAVTVHDVAGRRVRGLHRGGLSAGRHELGWDLRDDSGLPVPSGVYFVRVEADGSRTSRKLLVRR